MSARIVLFGATGYMGELAARALAARGVRPVLAARNVRRLQQLATQLGGLDTAAAGAARPDTVRALVERGDVLVSTVGPFARYGGPRSRRRSPPAPTTWTRPAKGRSYARSSSDTGPPRALRAARC
jgi:uncharacterized protein YbjT (DUF2867 family)